MLKIPLQEKYKLLYFQKQVPIFQNKMYESAVLAKNCPRGDIELVESLETGFIYNNAFKPELMVYDEDYQSEQGVSDQFLNHLKMAAEIVLNNLGQKSIIEIGCGKGLFLQILSQRGCDITGYDPTYEGNDSRILREYFLPSEKKQAKGFVLRHVLEHLQNPYEFLNLLKSYSGGREKIYIEVPCFDWICKHDAWFDIIYEHVNYFRIADFYRMFGSVIESGHLFGGQYLYVVADLSSLRKPVINQLDRVKFPNEFGGSLNKALESHSKNVAIWGGAAKGVMFALNCEHAGYPITMAIDINPAKQGKYMPATGILVQSPQEALMHLPHGATIFVMNSNYLEEIKLMSKNYFNYIGIDNA